MNTNKGRAKGGLGIVGALTIIFIVLKLTGLINWSWIWVLSPLWISVCLCVILLLVFSFSNYLDSRRKSTKK